MLDYSRNPEIMERLKGQLRPYQIKGVARATRYRTHLFDMYMGMGKTVTCLTALFSLRPKKVLILCGKAALGVWRHEVREWFPEYADPNEFTVIKAQGNPSQRQKLWARDTTFYIATKETFIRDKPNIKFDAYIIDEVHRIPKHQTKTFKALEKLLRPIPIKFMLTGTWIKRHAARGWRQLHLLNPKAFPSYWKFVNRYCLVIDGMFGKEIVGPKNTEEFYHVISPYVYRYHKTEGNIPKGVRKLIWVDMSPEQEKIYQELAENMFTQLESGELIISQVSIATFTKHRQLLNCPKILSPTLGLGTAFETLLDYLKETEDDPEEQHCVLFSPFKASLPYFEEELKKRGYATFMFTGGTSADEVHERAKAFRALQGKKSVAMGTIDFAESFNLGTASRSHFIGTVFDGDPMKQAEARLSRADSDLKQLRVHKYWLYNDTIDEDRVDVLRERASHVRKLFRHVDELRTTLHIGATKNK